MTTRLFPNTGHKLVDNIVLRNLLPERFDGQEVTVRDATDDPLLGSGSAAYKWMASQNRWALMWSDIYPTMSFAHEDLPIVNGNATASNIPADGIVWSSYVIDTDQGILQDIKPRVTLNNLNLLTNDYDGLTLRITYAYGSTSAQINSINDHLSNRIDNKADQEHFHTDSLDFNSNNNTLVFTRTNGEVQTIDLSKYLDNNISAIESATYDSDNSLLVFTREDGSTFDIDASMFFDDTNMVTSVAGKTGVVTLGINDISLLQTTLNTFVLRNDIIATFNAVSESNADTAEYVNNLLGV
jgi:hypothetical protein